MQICSSLTAILCLLAVELLLGGTCLQRSPSIARRGTLAATAGPSVREAGSNGHSGGDSRPSPAQESPAPTSPPLRKLDTFGGWSDVSGKTTGAFHIETINGRPLLITPDGHGFVALGVNHLGVIRFHGPEEPDLFRKRYGGNWEKFADDVLRHYNAWGLNTVDDDVEPLRKVRPFFASRDLVRTAKYYGKPGDRNPYSFPDVFSSAVKTHLEQQVETLCRAHRDNSNLIAYYWTDTPTWDIHKTRRFRGTDWVSEIRNLPAHSPGRKQYARFLRNRYRQDIAQFGRAYRLAVTSFEELEHVDLSELELDTYEVERDDQDFLGLIARTYYGIVGPTMRRCDPDHMIFGEKYLLGDIPQQVIMAAVPYIDAIAVQPGDGYIPIYTPGDTYPAAELTALHERTGKPIMICDHQVSFATARYPTSIWPYHQRESEQAAAAATERFLVEAFQTPFIIGYMRCQYIDRFATRRNASKLGLIRDDGTPRQHLVEATTRSSRAVKRLVRQAILRAGP